MLGGKKRIENDLGKRTTVKTEKEYTWEVYTKKKDRCGKYQ